MEIILGTQFKACSTSQVTELRSQTMTLLYFSAFWCPPGVLFTKKLSEIYKKINIDRKEFDIVYISLDNTKEEYDEHLLLMPWLSIPYDKQQRLRRIIDYYRITTLPCLILIDASGKSLATQCKRDIERLGINAVNFWGTYFAVQLSQRPFIAF